VDKVRAKCPEAQIILMAVFPRGEKPDNPFRAKIAAINKGVAKLAEKPRVKLVDLTAKLTNADGTISKDVMSDFLHPAAKGYAIWAEALGAVLPK
jgi:lysophospholipase L1-like esterase